ncbi:MAG: hypothetical protein AB9866_10995 [Syntrophobacteraceae bacterium]
MNINIQKPKSWMTATGAVLSAIAGGLQAAVQVCPVPKWIPWLNFLSALAVGGGAPLMALGIRRRITAQAAVRTRKPRAPKPTEQVQ